MNRMFGFPSLDDLEELYWIKRDYLIYISSVGFVYLLYLPVKIPCLPIGGSCIELTSNILYILAVVTVVLNTFQIAQKSNPRRNYFNGVGNNVIDTVLFLLWSSRYVLHLISAYLVTLTALRYLDILPISFSLFSLLIVASATVFLVQPIINAIARNEDY